MHTKYNNHSDDELLVLASQTVKLPETDDHQLIHELALRFRDALDELREQDLLIEAALAEHQLETVAVH